MMRTSVHMEFIVSIRGWAIRHGSRNFDLPILQLPTNLHHHPTLPCLPYQDLGNSNHQIGSLASPGETLHHMPHKNQKIQDSCEKSSSQKQGKRSNHTNLPFPALFAAYKVGCCAKVFLQCFSGPPTWAQSHLAFQSKATLQSVSLLVRFNSDSYPIGADSYASKCMVNKAHLFEHLRLNKVKGQVNGINDG